MARVRGAGQDVPGRRWCADDGRSCKMVTGGTSATTAARTADNTEGLTHCDPRTGCPSRRAVEAGSINLASRQPSSYPIPVVCRRPQEGSTPGIRADPAPRGQERASMILKWLPGSGHTPLAVAFGFWNLQSIGLGWKLFRRGRLSQNPSSAHHSVRARPADPAAAETPRCSSPRPASHAPAARAQRCLCPRERCSP
jgi:hypothetical protein